VSTPIRPSAAPKGNHQPDRLWLTPPEVARERGIGVAKVLGWIRSGELEAVNLAATPHGPPRWRVSRAALAAFDAARGNRTSDVRGGGTARRSRRPRRDTVEEFF
jgi:hypothetical protein